jgi:hypothetical protein
VHYVFIVWLQYLMLPVALFAAGKAAVVFGVTLALSWFTAVTLGNIAWGHQWAQVKRWFGTAFGEPAPATNLVKPDELPR